MAAFVVPALIAAGVAVGSAIGGGAAASSSGSRKSAKRLMNEDLEALRQGQLGLTQGQKSQMVNQAAQDIQAQTSGMTDMGQRAAAASGGIGRSGYSAAALRDIADVRANAIAKARMQTEALSQQKAESENARIRANVQRRDEMITQQWVALAGIAAGGGASAAGGLSQGSSGTASKEEQFNNAAESVNQQ